MQKIIYALWMPLLLVSFHGKTQVWEALNSGTIKHLRDVSFSSPLTGYVVGLDSTILKTTDGGDTWFPLVFPGVDHYPSNQGNMEAVSFVDDQSGFVAYQFNNAPVQTINGGNSWNSTTMTLASICNAAGLSIWSPSQGVLFGRGCFGGAWLSFYNGVDWGNPELLYYGLQQSGITGFSRDSVSGQMFATVGEGVLVRSNNLFSTFDTLRLVDTNLYDVEWVENHTIYVLREDLFEPLLVSQDSGNTFVPDPNYMATFAYPSLYDIDMHGPNAGFMVGDALQATQGILWYKDQLGGWNYELTDHPMRKVQAVNAQLAFAVGDSGQIYRYRTGLSSVELQTEMSLQLYPNPLQSGGAIHCAYLQGKNLPVVLYDLSGKLVWKGFSQGDKIRLDHLMPGVYVFEIEGESLRTKLVIY